MAWIQVVIGVLFFLAIVATCTPSETPITAARVEALEAEVRELRAWQAGVRRGAAQLRGSLQ